MSRAKEFINLVWDQRNNQGADTEEKLVAAILSLTADYVKSYTAQNNITVLDKNDLIQLAEEIKNESNSI
jgi:predicted transcriptional regulator